MSESGQDIFVLKNELKEKIASWVTESNLEEADGMERNQIFQMFGNKEEPIAVIPNECLYLFEPIVDNKIYSGKGYFLDHIVNHHDEINPKEFLNIQNDIDDYSNIYKDPKNESIVFETEKNNKKYSVVVKKDEEGKLVFYKSYHYGSKTKKRFINLNVKKMSVEAGISSISHSVNAEPGRLLSALNDNFKITPKSDLVNKDFSINKIPQEENMKEDEEKKNAALRMQQEDDREQALTTAELAKMAAERPDPLMVGKIPLSAKEFNKGMSKEIEKEEMPKQAAETKALSKNEQDEKLEKQRSFEGRYYYNGNAKNLIEGTKSMKMPFLGYGVAKETNEKGDIVMHPVSIRSYTSGKSYAGTNLLIAQKYASDLGMKPNKDGNIYLITYRQAGEKNIKKGQPHFPIASFDAKNERINYYQLYSENAVIDKSRIPNPIQKTPAMPGQSTDPAKTRKVPPKNPEIVVDASNPKLSYEEYLGKWEAATKLGAKFVTSKETMQNVKEQMVKELEPEVQKGLSGKVYAKSAAIEKQSKAVVHDFLQDLQQAQEPDKAIQKSKEIERKAYDGMDR